MWSNVVNVINLREPNTREKIRAIVSRCCNKEGIAKKCPEKISKSIYNEIILPLETEIHNLKLARKYEDEKDSHTLECLRQMLSEGHDREINLMTELKFYKKIIADHID